MTEFEKCLIYGRKDKRLSQGEIAELAGLERTDIINLESGRFVRLEEDTLRKIAEIVGMDAGMFLSMYHAEFQQELRKARSGPPAGKEDSAPQVESAHQEPVLSPDLMDLGKAIMAMPADVKENLVVTIKMLVQTVSIRAA